MSSEEKRKKLTKWILEADESVLNEVNAVYNIFSENKEISQEHKKILDNRLKQHNKNPTAGKDWNDLKVELSSKYGF